MFARLPCQCAGGIRCFAKKRRTIEGKNSSVKNRCTGEETRADVEMDSPKDRHVDNHLMLFFRYLMNGRAFMTYDE